MLIINPSLLSRTIKGDCFILEESKRILFVFLKVLFGLVLECGAKR